MKDTTEIARSVLDRRDAWRRQRQDRVRRTALKCLALALTLAVLGGGVMAAGTAGDWFTAFFDGRTEEGLSQSQEQFIQASAMYPSVTSVSGDYALTIDYALSDGLDYYFLMTLTGMEPGTDPEDLRVFEIWQLYPTGHPEYTGKGGTGGSCFLWEQSAEEELKILMHMQLHSEEGYDFSRLSLHLRNIMWEEGTVSAMWHFDDLAFVNLEEAVELLKEPFVVEGWRSDGREDCEVRVDSIQLRPFSMVIEFSRLEWMARPDLKAQIVMKDGTVMDVGFSSSYGPDGGTMDHNFAVPLILSEVDHVLLSNGMKLEMP